MASSYRTIAGISAAVQDTVYDTVPQLNQYLYNSIGVSISFVNNTSDLPLQRSMLVNKTLSPGEETSLVSPVPDPSSNQEHTPTTTSLPPQDTAFSDSVVTTIESNTDDKQKENRPFIAIAVCTRSKSTWRSVDQASFHQLLLPSIPRTITEKEFQDYRVEVVIVFDTGDTFWENDENRQAMQDSTTIPLNWIAIPKRKKNRIPMNELCRAAYEHGADYIVRINDDTEFVSEGWITLATEKLQSFTPPNVGAVGPTCHEGNDSIMTHDMVHRTHLDIFGVYYPPEFDNWFLDDWITYVYGNKRTSKLPNWVVKHHTGKHGTRYRPDWKFREYLGKTLSRDHMTIRQYYKNPHALVDKHKGMELLGTSDVTLADGPIAVLHQERLPEHTYNSAITASSLVWKDAATVRRQSHQPVPSSKPLSPSRTHEEIVAERKKQKRSASISKVSHGKQSVTSAAATESIREGFVVARKKQKPSAAISRTSHAKPSITPAAATSSSGTSSSLLKLQRDERKARTADAIKKNQERRQQQRLQNQE